MARGFEEDCENFEVEMDFNDKINVEKKEVRHINPNDKSVEAAILEMNNKFVALAANINKMVDRPTSMHLNSCY